MNTVQIQKERLNIIAHKHIVALLSQTKVLILKFKKKQKTSEKREMPV